MIYKFAYSNGEIQLANAISQKDYLSMLDQIPDLDINNAAAGTYNGRIEIDLESGAIPTEKQLEYVINYDLHRHADGFSLKMEQGAQYKYSYDGQNLDVWKVNDSTGDPHHFEKIGPGHDVNAEGRIYYYNPNDIFHMVWVNRGTPRLNRLAIPLVRQWCLQNLGAAPTYVGEETDEALEKNADVIPGWTTRPENWSPIKVDQLSEPYDFKMPKAVEDIFVHNMQCPECQHNLRQAPGGVYCEYCGWTPRIAMAERTGDPQLDQLILSYIRNRMLDPMMRDPNWAAGACEVESAGLAQYLNKNGTQAWVQSMAESSDEHYKSFEEMGYNDRQHGQFDSHAVVVVEIPSGRYSIDLSAAQYGYKEFPMIQQLDGNNWQREWTAATVEDSEPPQNFGFLKEPHNDLYPAAWEDNEKMRPEANNTIKQHVLKQLAINHYDDADDWIYFTVYGSGASYNWDEDGDFDVQMWIDFEAFNTKHPNAAFTSDDLLAEVRRVVQMVNFPSFKELGLDTPECEGLMLIQFYPKPGKGTSEENLSSKPYACYDMETDEWLQKPKPITPTFYGEHFIMVFNKATDIAIQAEALLDELERNTVNWQFWSQMYNEFHNDKYETIANDSKRNAEAEKEGIKVLFQGVFGERQKAYSPEGEGIEDEGDLTQKLLEVWGIFQRLKHFARQPLPWEEQDLPKPPEESDEKEETEHKSSSYTWGKLIHKDLSIKLAGWSDIMEDAQQLREESGVQITHNGAQHVEGIVQSQSSPGTTYATSFERQDPNSQAITQWTCTCPWGEVSWGRTRQWKKYEGRPCKHLLALYWQSLATPLDENQPEAQGQGQLFNPQQIAQPGPAPLVPGAGPTPAQVPNAAPPGTPQAVMPLPPTGVQAPPPPAQSQITQPGQGGTVSIPGTLSKMREVESTLFENGGTVRNRVPMYGITRDGYTMLVPAGQRGTVLFSDDHDTIAIFPLNQAGILEPHLVRVQESSANFAGAEGDPFVHRHSKLLHYR